MKKIIISLFIFLSAFFVFGFSDVKALEVDINFDKHEHFNFFYEMKQDTAFYHFLVDEGVNLPNKLLEYNNSFLIQGYPLISIYYLDDLDLEHSYTNGYYAIRVNSTYYYDSFGSRFYYNYGKSVNYNADTQLFNLLVSYIYQDYGIFNDYYIFDIDSNYLGHIEGSAFTGTNNSLSSFMNFSVDDFDYFLSLIYYSLNSIDYNGTTKPTLEVKNVIIDNETFRLESSDQSIFTRAWHRLIETFSGVEYLNDSDYNLEYFRENYILSSVLSFPGLISTLNSNVSLISVPNGYSSSTFTLSNNLSLFPNTSCSYSEMALYVSSNLSEDITLYKHAIGSEDDSNSLQFTALYSSVFTTQKNGTIKINPLVSSYQANTTSSTNNTITSFSSSDFVNYYYRFNRLSNKGTYTVYYNPTCYTKQLGSETITWTNPNTSTQITIDDSFNNWSDPENVGAGNSVDFELNLVDLINSAWDGAKTFILSGVEIISLSAIFLDSLPGEVGAVILAAFSIGILIFLISFVKKII